MDNRRRKKKNRHTLIWIIFFEILLVMIGLAVVIFVLNEGKPSSIDQLIEETIKIDFLEETEEDENESEQEFYVPRPYIDEQILSINPYSRPGKKIKRLNYIVIHYLANPKTTAQENHDYFESLKDLKTTSMSANYVVGIDGEIIHCVPDDEIAYASNKANSYSISIENCHLDESGRFTDKTYTSLVDLTAYLSERYGIDREHIIRHYDVTGKDCPKYFVEHPEKWEAFLDDVMLIRNYWYEEAMKVKESEQAEKERRKAEENSKTDELTAFLENNAMTEELPPDNNFNPLLRR